MRNKVLLSLAVLGCLLLATSLSAQATRTWVSGVGNDANPCSRTAPCKTFAGAISKTATCGEINAVDPGGFGAVTINKSITINGAAQLSGILNAGVHGVIVNLTVSDVCNTVILRWLDINGSGTLGLSAVRDVSSVGHSLHIEHVDIAHQARGVEFVPTVASKLFMKDVDIRHTTAHGIDIHPTAAQTATLSLHDVRSRQSAGDGLRLQNNAKGTVTSSQLQGNLNGVNVFGVSVSMTFVDSDISNNTGTGLINASGATTFIDGCSIIANNTGILNNGGGVVNGFGNNAIANNTPGGDVVGAAVVTLGHP